MTPQQPTSLELWPIGNCQVSALIDESGAIVWGCVPRVDGDPTFCALLRGGGDQDAGLWRFELENQVSTHQRYLRNTPILVTRLEDATGGAVEVYDFAPGSSVREGCTALSPSHGSSARLRAPHVSARC